MPRIEVEGRGAFNVPADTRLVDDIEAIGK